MKTIPLFFAILFFSFSGLIAQDFTSTKNVLLQMKSGSSSDLLNALDNYEPVTEREKKLLSRNTDSLKVMMQHYAFEVYYAELNIKKRYNLADKNALQGHVKYNKLGYPSIVLPKAVVKKLVKNKYDADYYFSLGVSVEHRSILGSLNSNIRPTISCDIKVYSPDREVVKNITHNYKDSSPIKSFDFPERKFDKLAFDHILILAEKLKPFVRQAVIETVARM